MRSPVVAHQSVASWLRCSRSSATICAHDKSTNCRVQLVLIHLSLRPNCQVFWAPWLLLLQNNWNCIMCTIPSLQWWISMIPFSVPRRMWACGDRWRRESNTACSLRCMHTQCTHTDCTHTICGVLRLNNLPPKAYLFLSSYSPNTHNKRVPAHTHALTQLPSTQQGKWDIQLWHAHTLEKKWGDASKQLVPFPLRELSLQCWGAL